MSDLIDVKYAARFLREVPLRDATPEILELHVVASRLLDQLLSERGNAAALLRDCHHSILMGCCSEDGLDCSEGVPLLHRLEALFPDLKAAADRDYRP